MRESRSARTGGVSGDGRQPSALCDASPVSASPVRPEGRSLLAGQIAAFGLTLGGVLLLAAEQGAYDIVVRQQVGVVIWWILALAVLAGLLPRTRPSLPGLVLLGGLAALGGWSALSLTWTSDAERTLTEVARIAMHLGVLLLLGVALGRDTWLPALAGASVAAVALVGYALGSRLAPDLLGEDIVAQAFDTSRLSRPLGYWNAVGAWAGMTSMLCLAWSAHARSGLIRGAALAAVPVAIATAYLTYSRASLVGTAIGLAVLLACSRNRFTLAAHVATAAVGGYFVVRVVRGAPELANATGEAGAGDVLRSLVLAAAGLFIVGWGTRRLGLDRVRLGRTAARSAFAVAAVAVAGAGIFAVATWGDTAWDQFRDPTNVVSDDPAERLRTLNGSRYLLWSAAWEATQDAPLQGSGAGTFEYTWNPRANSTEFVRDAHSFYVEVTSELGFPGLALTLLWLIGIVWTLARAILRSATPSERGALAGAAAAVAAFFVGAGVDWLWESTAVAVLALVLTGCALAATGTPTGSLSWAPRVGLAGVALLLCLAQLPGLVSTSEIRASQQAFAAGSLDDARLHARDAVETQPWAASPFVQRALVSEALGDLDSARADLIRAEERARLDWRAPLIRARVEARRGDASAALAAYRRARRLRPEGKFFDDQRRGASVRNKADGA